MATRKSRIEFAQNATVADPFGGFAKHRIAQNHGIVVSEPVEKTVSAWQKLTSPGTARHNAFDGFLPKWDFHTEYELPVTAITRIHGANRKPTVVSVFIFPQITPSDFSKNWTCSALSTAAANSVQAAEKITQLNLEQRAAIDGAKFHTHVRRLSDPDKRTEIANKIAGLASDKGLAQKFLESIGVATPDGRLTKNFGG